eukprot:g3769.t1
MKSFALSTLLLAAVLVISTEAAFPARALLQQTSCEEACDAASRTDSGAIQTIINEIEDDICNCICDSSNGERVMHFAVRGKCHECIENMIASPSRCSRDTRDFAGNNALHLTAELCQLGMDEELIGMGFPIDNQNSPYDTPLCVGSRQNNPDCGQTVRLLMQAGANPDFVCSDGETPCAGCVNDNVCNVLSQDTDSTCPQP